MPPSPELSALAGRIEQGLATAPLRTPYHRESEITPVIAGALRDAGIASVTPKPDRVWGPLDSNPKSTPDLSAYGVPEPFGRKGAIAIEVKLLSRDRKSHRAELMRGLGGRVPIVV